MDTEMDTNGYRTKINDKYQFISPNFRVQWKSHSKISKI